MWTKDWKEEFKSRINNTDGDRCTFGGNCFYEDESTVKYFQKFEKLGAAVELDLDESARIYLTDCTSEQINDVLLYILTESPRPTDTYFNKKKKILNLTWS